MNTKMKLPPAIEEAREKFMQTEDLVLIDGTTVTPEEMWEVACLPFTGKYRHALDFASQDMLINLARHKYLMLSAKDRLKKMHANGVPIIFTFGGGMGLPTPELVHGCHGLTFGLTQYFNEVWMDARWDLQEEAHRWTSFESCPGEPPAALMARDGEIPTDMIISGTGVFGDLPCANQLIRRWPIPLHFIDLPYNGKGKDYALEYVTEQLWETVRRISQITGKEVTVDDLNNGIKMLNELWDSFREYSEIVRSAEVPPISSIDNMMISMLVFDFCSDPVAMASANRALNKELKERVEKGIKPPGVADDPIRIYMCEKMVLPPGLARIEELGGVVLGPEVSDSYYMCPSIPSDTDDPCRAMAEWALNKSPWSNALPLKDRTNWVLEMVEKYRAEGVIHSAVWGCQLDPQFSKYMADAIKRKFNIPSLMTILEDVPMEVNEEGRYVLKGNQLTRIEGFMEMLKARRKASGGMG